EQLKLDYWKDLFAPDKVPEITAPHDGQLHADECDVWEFPSLDLVQEKYSKHGIRPAVIIVPGDDGLSEAAEGNCLKRGIETNASFWIDDAAEAQNCVRQLYEDDFKAGGFESYFVVSADSKGV